MTRHEPDTYLTVIFHVLTRDSNRGITEYLDNTQISITENNFIIEIYLQ